MGGGERASLSKHCCHAWQGPQGTWARGALGWVGLIRLVERSTPQACGPWQKAGLQKAVHQKAHHHSSPVVSPIPILLRGSQLSVHGPNTADPRAEQHIVLGVARAAACVAVQHTRARATSCMCMRALGIAALDRSQRVSQHGTARRLNTPSQLARHMRQMHERGYTNTNYALVLNTWGGGGRPPDMHMSVARHHRAWVKPTSASTTCWAGNATRSPASMLHAGAYTQADTWVRGFADGPPEPPYHAILRSGL